MIYELVHFKICELNFELVHVESELAVVKGTLHPETKVLSSCIHSYHARCIWFPIFRI